MNEHNCIMEEKIDDIVKKLDKLLFITLGDEDFIEDGMVTVVKKLKARVSQLERRMLYYVAFASGFGAGIMFLITNILK